MGAHAPRAHYAGVRPGLFPQGRGSGVVVSSCRAQEMVNPLPDQRNLCQHSPKKREARSHNLLLPGPKCSFSPSCFIFFPF